MWLLGIVMFVLIAPMIAMSQILAYWRTDIVDDQMFAYFGWRIANGATVYLDVWDNKPPGIYWINAIAMLISGGDYLGVIVMCTLALVVSHIAFFVIANSVYYRGAAALATILLSFYLTHAHYTGGTNRTEVFLVAFELVAVALYMRGWARDRSWIWYVAGLCCGVAFLFKQVGLIGWGAMGLHTIILVLTRELPWKTGLRRCLLLAGGAATTIAAGALYLAAQGALGEALYAVFTFNQAYFAAGDSRIFSNLATRSLLWKHIEPILLAPMMMAAAAAIHAFLWWLRPALRPREIEEPLKAQRPVCPRYFLLFAIWFVVAMYGAFLSPMGYRHYLVPTIPPLMLMAGYLINVLRTEMRLVDRLQQRAWVIAAFLALGFFAWNAVKWQFAEVSKVWVFRMEPMLESGGKEGRAKWEVVGDVVKRLTRPDDRIQCWGFEPGIYLHARRVNACRYFTTEKIAHAPTEADKIVNTIETTLKADPPAVLVISAEEFMRMEGRGVTPSEFDLLPWIRANYEMVREIPEFRTVYIFLRKDRVEAAAG
jgi:hypothetical protein